MIRKIISLRPVKFLLRTFFNIFYKKKYLYGRYFDEKCMGWLWALKGIPSRIFGANHNVPWPVNTRTIVSGAENIVFDPSDLHIFQVPGCYWQAHDGKINVGRNCYIAPNVGIITTNHDIMNPSVHVPGKNIKINNDCWIGMNSVILPGVILGEHTVVAAGAVVTKSFEDGWCVIGGVPAQLIKKIER